MTKIGTRVIVPAILAFGAVWLAGCQNAPAPDERAAEETAVREADMAWAKTIIAKDTEAFLSYYADNAVLLAPNHPLATGKDAIRAWIKPIFESAGYSGSSGPEKVEVARGGDMAYVWGTYKSTRNAGTDKAVEDHGKYLEVWKKQPDGKWKCAADMINSDLPAVAR